VLVPACREELERSIDELRARGLALLEPVDHGLWHRYLRLSASEWLSN
jgi:hypothetical protein